MTAGEISTSMEREGVKADQSDIDYRFMSTSAVYKVRWEKISDALTDLEVNSLEADVLWGPQIRDSLAELARQISDLNFNIGMYLRELSDHGSGKPEDMERYEKYVFWMGPENDEFDKKLSSAIEAVDDLLRPFLKI
jgi:hypothetical protein